MANMNVAKGFSNTNQQGGRQTADESKEPYVDRKKWLWTMGGVVPSLPLIGGALYWYSGLEIMLWLVIAFVYTILPALDYWIGTDQHNPPESAVKALESNRFYRYLTYLYIPIQYTVFVWGAWAVTQWDLSWFGYLGVALSVGGVGGVGINTAHELGHKKATLERWLSKITLAQTCYGHFFVEHNRGHHKNVATPADPASSRMGESFYSFLPRTVIGSAKSAWQLEKDRLQRQGKSVWHWQNENLQAWAMSVVLWGVFLAIFGWVLLPFLLIQAIYGFSLLEAVNYVEHYGLARQKLSNGRYERCQPEHSWNSNHLITNLLLYHLQRHSDHHANPTRRYQALRHYSDAPQLPSGYAGMILLAYFPPLYYRVMDHRVVEHYDGDLSKANLQPSKAQQLLQKWRSKTDSKHMNSRANHGSYSSMNM